MRVIVANPVQQPSLVEVLGDINPATEAPWSVATLRLWSELSEFPSTEMLRPAQWSLLARAMILDDAVVAGNARVAAEARLQLAKFGIAPDDVARLRIVFAAADEADAKRPEPTESSSRSRRGGLRPAG